MRLLLFMTLIISLATILNGSLYVDFKNNFLKLFQKPAEEKEKLPKITHNNGYLRSFVAQNYQNNPKKIWKNASRNIVKSLYIGDEKQKRPNYFHRKSNRDLFDKPRPDYRRKYSSDSSSDTESSSRELKDWKDEWKEYWLLKKFEALNTTVVPGDTVNMVAARPWGVPCGDPNHYDMPWGTCTLPMECEAEYRIYRGDYFCGRTEFICCSLKVSTFDMYQGFDVSFADSSLSTDTEERKERDKDSKEKKRSKKRRNRRKRRRERERRKRKIKKNIRRIVREIKRLLSRTYRNGTTERKRKTKMLKKFVKDLKKKYKKDRKTVKDLHEVELIKVDTVLQRKLNEIRYLNENFMKNDTFRSILINRTMTRTGARMLVEAYPELSTYLDVTRRSGGAHREDYLEYDIEYGLNYY